jgi:hypothetical protein
MNTSGVIITYFTMADRAYILSGIARIGYYSCMGGFFIRGQGVTRMASDTSYIIMYACGEILFHKYFSPTFQVGDSTASSLAAGASTACVYGICDLFE